MQWLVHRAVFPHQGQSTYTLRTFGSQLLWVPPSSTHPFQLPCLLYLPRNTEHPEHLIIYAHGNGCDLGYFGCQASELAESMGVAVLLWELPGYGLAGGRASPESFNSAARAAYDYATRPMSLGGLGYEARYTVLYGESIGTGPTCHLAASLSAERRPPCALLLKSPYMSIGAIARQWARPLGWLVGDMWDNLGAVARADCPLFIAHGRQDELIGVHHAERLVEAARAASRSRLVQLHVPPRATHCVWDAPRDLYEPMAAFLGGIRALARLDSVPRDPGTRSPGSRWNYRRGSGSMAVSSYASKAAGDRGRPRDQMATAVAGARAAMIPAAAVAAAATTATSTPSKRQRRPSGQSRTLEHRLGPTGAVSQHLHDPGPLRATTQKAQASPVRIRALCSAPFAVSIVPSKVSLIYVYRM